MVKATLAWPSRSLITLTGVDRDDRDDRTSRRRGAGPRRTGNAEGYRMDAATLAAAS